MKICIDAKVNSLDKSEIEKRGVLLTIKMFNKYLRLVMIKAIKKYEKLEMIYQNIKKITV